MKAFALFVATLSVAAQAGAPSWPVSTDGIDSWNGLNNWNGLNSWKGLNSWNSLSSYPYGINQWSCTAWPSTYYGGYNGWYGGADKTVVQANVAKVNPWGLSPAYGYGYNNYLGALIPTAAKYVAANSGSVHVAPLVGHAINQKLIVG